MRLLFAKRRPEPQHVSGQSVRRQDRPAPWFPWRSRLCVGSHSASREGERLLYFAAVARIDSYILSGNIFRARSFSRYAIYPESKCIGNAG